MSIKIGKASFGGGSKFVSKKYFKLKDGEQAYRILPPLGDLADSGRWSVFHSVHYGYKTLDGKQKPFLSSEVRNRKNNMVEVPDAAKERITTLKTELEKAQKIGNKAALEKLNPLVGPTGMYNLDNNHYMNVIDAQGNIGILKLRHKAKLALDMQIKALNAEGVDPLSLENGRFFVFTRSGMGRDTTFAVKVLKEKIKVEGVGNVERDVVHTIDSETIGRLGLETAELDKIFKRFTAEDVRQIVETSDLLTGTSTYLDTLFAKKAVEQAAEAEDSYNDIDESLTTPAPRTTIVRPVAAKTTVVKPVVQSLENLSDEDFLKSLGEI